ncbi:Nicotinamidase-related amidase [Pseudomonas sp. LAMO17WK12:I10]|uniref:isochorismatase family protein n=1 Tax=unclassified Pseudomonas TaxID=196821 RepID=UPI000BD6BE3D|nr:MULTISPECIES: isochorismatase family protein [unclassified Pseudomonas]PXX75714.1 nicotinamidase-related amidase [Pseudomonas sp. LAMO17WK12:I9]SNY09518.1 Nicotinamidase-related amidase [Pseudomonas sp. LAMO17WK12:I10]
MRNSQLFLFFFFGVIVSSVAYSESESVHSEQVISESVKSAHVKSDYLIKTWRKSHFALDKAGGLIPERKNGQAFYKVKEGKYEFQRALSKDKTALVVMDPWEDTGSPKMNKHYKKVFSQRLVPLAKHSIAMGLKVVVITNDPKTINLGYAARINPNLQVLVDAGKVDVLYHSDMDDRKFEVYLKSAGIDTLIYSGFASNMCVIGMPTGMIPMFHRGFRLFFVSEASAATEYGNTWGDGAVHKAMTSMISQWVGEIISFKDFMRIKPI